MTGRAASADRTAADHDGAALDVRGLTVHYGDVLALDDVSLTLRRGTICGLIGMNGSGKSTLFKAIMGTVKPDRGSVSIAGLAPKQARRAGIYCLIIVQRAGGRPGERIKEREQAQQRAQSDDHCQRADCRQR